MEISSVLAIVLSIFLLILNISSIFGVRVLTKMAYSPRNSDGVVCTKISKYEQHSARISVTIFWIYFAIIIFGLIFSLIKK